MTPHSWFRSPVLWAAILLLVGGYFRVVAIADTVVDSPIRADARDYFLSAYNLVHHGVYSRSRATLEDPPGTPVPDAYRAPGVALLIAPFMYLWPDHESILQHVKITNVVLGLAAIAAAFLAAWFALPLPAAIAVGLLTATSPHLISLTVYMLSETPSTFLAAVFLALCALGVPSGRRMRVAYFLGLGMIIGGLSLFRPVFLAFAPVMALAFPNRRDKLQAIAFGCIGAALVAAPWMIRNALNVPPGGPSLLATVTLEASYRDFMLNGDPKTFPLGSHFDPRFESLVTNLGDTLREVLGKILADPAGMMLWYFVQKPVYLFQWSNIDGAGDVFVYPVVATPFRTSALFAGLHDVHQAGHALLLVLAAAGAAGAWWPRMTQSVPQAKLHVLRAASLLFVFLYLIHIPFVVNTRYALPILPAMYLLAVFVFVFPVRMVLEPLAAAGRRSQPVPAVSRLQPKPASRKKKRARAARPG